MVMEIEGKEIRFAHDLWVQYGGVRVAEKGQRMQVEGVDEESYLKVLNHFGRVLKLFTFEGGQWVDADTGLPARGVDEAQAGRIPEAARSVRPPKRSTAT